MPQSASRFDRRTRWTTLVSGLLLVGCIGTLGCWQEALPLEDRKALAARRGIEWLIAQKTMPPRWSTTVFAYLVKTVPDEDLALTTRAILDEAMAQPIVQLAPNLQNVRFLEYVVLRPVVLELLRRKRIGEPYEERKEELQQLIHRREKGLWRQLPFTQQLVLLSMFEDLGVETSRSEEEVIRDIRSVWAQGEQERLVVDLDFMLAVTHVPITESGYFERYLEPRDFEVEIEVMRRALRHYLSASVPDYPMWLDVQAEILIGYKLLGLPFDEDAEAIVERILDLQHEDGSWGEPTPRHHRLHATMTAVLALLDYPAEFRVSDEAR